MWKRMWAINFIFLTLCSGALVLLAILRLIEMTTAITFGTILLVFALFMYFRQRSNTRFRPDERIRRITTRAMGLSFQLSVFVVVAFYFLDYSKVLILSSAQILTALMLFMSFSYFVIVLILRRFGDISE